MTAKQRFCPRCAKPATRRATPEGVEIWDCADHGVIYKAGKISPAAQAAPAAAASPAPVIAIGMPRKLH